MSRIPPGLLYLTIYNPTLRPDTTIPPDDEDAEEQAHILFYTARERAVSRDKMLRQVGLAKALVNFSGMFCDVQECANVHSQSRRMIMLSPEPDFWIHACVEVAKTPRQVAAKSRNKAKSKESSPQTELTYDYHDGSINDLALKTQMLRGQQALELQLERFFTVWAWKWDIEDDLDFGDHLGVSLHPLHRSLTLILDNFAQEHLPPDAVSFALIPPHVIPSTRLLSSRYPDVLIRHVLSKIPPPPARPVETADSATDDKQTTLPAELPVSAAHDVRTHGHKSSSFMSMDMRNLKWMWNGLTFGKTASAKSTAPSTPAGHSATTPEPETSKEDGPGTPETKVEDVSQQKEVATVNAEVDTDSLRDAITSENVHSPASHTSSVKLPPLSPPLEHALTLEDTTTKELDAAPEQDEEEKAEVDQADLDAAPDESPSDESPMPVEHVSPVEAEPEVAVARPNPPTFLPLTVHLARADMPTETERKTVLHATSDHCTVAFVVEHSSDVDPTKLGDQAVDLFADLKRCIEEHGDMSSRDADSLPPTVTSILEKRTEHIISSGLFTSSSQPPLKSKSEHLFRGQELLHSDLDISEVFSRGQHPQHWHISRKGLGTNSSGEPVNGEVFMEVARKESTLTDVDNELATLVKRTVQVGPRRALKLAPFQTGLLSESAARPGRCMACCSLAIGPMLFKSGIAQSAVSDERRDDHILSTTILVSLCEATLRNVVGAVIIVRGGDRQYLPQYTFFAPMDQDTSITVLGEQQEFQLGTLLRSIYLNDTSPSFIQGIWGETSLFNESEVTVRADASVNGGNLISSAVALSQGLWPPSSQEALQLANGTVVFSPLGGYQYVPIESVDPDEEPTLNALPGCMAWNERNNQLSSSAAFATKAADSASLLSQLGQYYPIAPPTLAQIGDVYDYMNVMAIHNATYASTLPSGYLEQARVLNDWLALNVFTDSNVTGVGNGASKVNLTEIDRNKVVAIVAGLSIMNDIVSTLYAMEDDSYAGKMFIDVVSFEPFVSLMNMTGVFESLPEPATVDYASALIFELRSTLSGQLSVRLNFKNGTSDDAFHTYPMNFNYWNGSDIPLDLFTGYFSSVRINNWYAWCSLCQNNQSTTCMGANLAAALANSTANSNGTSSLPQNTSSGLESAASTGGHKTFSPVGAGFLGAGLAIVVLSAIFGFLVFLGVFSYGGARKLHRFSNTSYRQRKRRVGDEMELHSEVNSVVGLKVS
ncbi:hypothetical protein NM688_g1524 [Phlebia brevispora]|uniref:Uncharacterized protein n=1 Tax=Phlebia brevispora TaxID=194682 RepID=A0ACC1TBJ2_9APHY|nr:hypothetical protein NM688_g1524 [Phlebia brevispora]